MNRRGPALTVEFGDDQVATISVDEADEAADVLNGLLARLRIDARAGQGEASAARFADRAAGDETQRHV